VAQALPRLPELPEWIAPGAAALRLPVFRRGAAPRPPAAGAGRHPARHPFWSRLAFDELLAGQLALALVRARLRRPAGIRHAGDGRLRRRIIDALPYALTASQQAAARAIADDLAQPLRMLRLLQGDVGSGKTVVALLAAAAVAETGRQAALMAPTEILARQHLKTIAPLAEAAGVRVASSPGARRARSGATARPPRRRRDRPPGRHPRADPGRRDLQGAGAAVVDEQHRFGVRERLALTEKGEAVDVLVLSATRSRARWC